MEAKRILIHNGGEYGEFFWNEREPRASANGGTIYSATWACYSSFGVFGHHWSHMGSPFAKFVADIGNDYLLSKIATEVFDAGKFDKWIRRSIFTSRATKEQKAEAIEAYRELKSYTDEKHLAYACYESVDISHCDLCWVDCDSQSHDMQAVGFAKKLWPGFVKHLQGAIAEVAP